MHLSHANTIKYMHVDADYINRFLQVGIFVVLFLVLLYAVERNSALSAERDIKHKQTQIVSAEESVSKLEIKAAQLESSQNIKSAALSVNMVPSKKINFINVDEISVSMK